MGSTQVNCNKEGEFKTIFKNLDHINKTLDGNGEGLKTQLAEARKDIKHTHDLVREQCEVTGQLTNAINGLRLFKQEMHTKDVVTDKIKADALSSTQKFVLIFTSVIGTGSLITLILSLIIK